MEICPVIVLITLLFLFMDHRRKERFDENVGFLSSILSGISNMAKKAATTVTKVNKALAAQEKKESQKKGETDDKPPE